MDAAGHLQIDALWDGARVHGIDIRSTRPAAARVLQGRGVDDVLATVPRLYAICAQAQAAAASSACEAAGDVEPDPVTRALRSARVTAEAATEHLWRLLLDWPALLGLESQRALFAEWYRRAAWQSGRSLDHYRAFGIALRTFVEDRLLARSCAQAMEHPAGLAPSALLAPLLDAVRHSEPQPTAPLMPLPELSAAELACLPADEDYARAPTWQNQPHETGALAQYARHPVIARLLAEVSRAAAHLHARVLALIDSVRRLSGDTVTPEPVTAHRIAPGVGIACVHSARGLLTHRVELDGHRVARYTVIAPTEWNFHPQGALLRDFVDCVERSESALLHRLRSAVLALDPCVGFDLGVRHA